MRCDFIVQRYAREGIDLSVSTLADQVGACTTVLQPLHTLIEGHVLAAERLHGDDTTVPILAKGKTVTGHIWTYVRDDRPFGSYAPRKPPSTTLQGIEDRSIPSAIFEASRASCRRTPTAAITAFTILRGYRAQSRRPSVGAIIWSWVLCVEDGDIRIRVHDIRR